MIGYYYIKATFISSILLYYQLTKFLSIIIKLTKAHLASVVKSLENQLIINIQ